MTLLDLYCGLGGWTRAFKDTGWSCTGVDIERFPYPGTFIHADVRTLPTAWIQSFDAVVASPPCEDFARAWLPWLRADHTPTDDALTMLSQAVALCDRERRLVECSVFAAKHQPGGIRVGSHVLWGDVPLLLPQWPRDKTRHTGTKPALRALIPYELARAVALHFKSS